MTKPRKHVLTLASGISIGLLVGVGMMIGTVHTMNSQPSATSQENPEATFNFDFPLHASSAHGGRNLVMATGSIDGDVEGLFVLDCLTGDLHCWVVNPRNMDGGFLGQFKQNVLGDLGLEKGKDPDYTITTGNIQPLRGAGVGKPANCVVYVGDGNSGNVVAYTLLWNPNIAAAGREQIGPLLGVALGKARPNVERPQ